MSLELGGRHLFTRKEPVLYTFPLPTVLHDLLDKGVKQGHGNLQLVPSPSNHHWGGGGGLRVGFGRGLVISQQVFLA